MADINLIGNDQNSSEKGSHGNEQYGDSKNYESDTYEAGGSLNATHDSEYDTQDPYMEQNYIKKSSKSIMYILIGACVILFSLLMYLLFSGDQDATTDPAVDEQAKAKSTVTEPAPLLHGLNQETLDNIDALLSAFSPQLKLSVIRYAQGEFIIETHARTKGPIEEFNAQLKQILRNVQIKEANQVPGSTKKYRVGMISGIVSQQSIWEQSDQLAQLNYIGENDLRTRIENYSNQLNLKLKNYHVGRTKPEDNFRKTMIKVKLIGDRNAAARFLKALNDDKINVNFAKIVLIAAKRSLKNQDVNLIIEIELFRKIA